MSALCYAGTGFTHLTYDGRATLCGLRVARAIVAYLERVEAHYSQVSE